MSTEARPSNARREFVARRNPSRRVEDDQQPGKAVLSSALHER
jgi:hypothetical protein